MQEVCLFVCKFNDFHEFFKVVLDLICVHLFVSFHCTDICYMSVVFNEEVFHCCFVCPIPIADQRVQFLALNLGLEFDVVIETYAATPDFDEGSLLLLLDFPDFRTNKESRMVYFYYWKICHKFGSYFFVYCVDVHFD